MFIISVIPNCLWIYIILPSTEENSSVLTAPKYCCSSIPNCILDLDYLELMFKSKLLQHHCYSLGVQTAVHEPLQALSTLWKQLLSL